MGYKEDLRFTSGWCNEWNKQDLHGAEQLPLMLDIWRACCERKLIFQKYTKGVHPFPHPQSMNRLAWLKLVWDFVCKNSNGFVMSYEQASMSKHLDYFGGYGSPVHEHPILSYQIGTGTTIIWYDEYQSYYVPATKIIEIYGDYFPLANKLDSTTVNDYVKHFDMLTTYHGESDGVGYVNVLRFIKMMLENSLYIPDETFPIYSSNGTLESNYLFKNYGSILDYAAENIPFVDEFNYYVGAHKHVVSLSKEEINTGYKINATLGGNEENIFNNLLKVDFTNLLTYK